jgi:Brp/Blh family beta-carotene 15,15'-monooxygenase
LNQPSGGWVSAASIFSPSFVSERRAINWQAVWPMRMSFMEAAVNPAIDWKQPPALRSSPTAFSGASRKKQIPSSSLCAGATIICAPSLLYPNLVAGYFAVLTGEDATALVRVLQWLAIPALAGTIFSAARCIRTRPAVAAELAVLAVSAVALPPLVFFLLYFCCLHSPRHLIDTVQGLNRATATATAIGLTLVTVGLGALFFVLSPSTQFDQRLLQITFIGLATLTVPHMILIEHYAARFQKGLHSRNGRAES